MKYKINRVRQYLDLNGFMYTEIKFDRYVNEHYKTWFNKFVPNNVKEKATTICLSNNDHLWHLFSNSLANCVEGKKANQLFIKENKVECYLFMEYEQICFKIFYASNLRLDFIPTCTDIYITDSDFKWTYVNSHEKHFGPYFYKPIKIDSKSRKTGSAGRCESF